MVRVRLWLGLGLGLELNGVRVIWLGGGCLISYDPVFIRDNFFYRYKQGRVRRWERTQ